MSNETVNTQSTHKIKLPYNIVGKNIVQVIKGVNDTSSNQYDFCAIAPLIIFTQESTFRSYVFDLKQEERDYFRKINEGKSYMIVFFANDLENKLNVIDYRRVLEEMGFEEKMVFHNDRKITRRRAFVYIAKRERIW